MINYDPKIFGTIAEWFSGLIAVIAIFFAIRESKVKIKITYKQFNEQIIVYIENKSNFDITINNVYTYYYFGGVKGGPEAIYNMNAHGHSDGFRLKPKEIKDIDVSMDIDFYLSKNKSMYILYGCQYQGYLKKETKFFRKLKSVQAYI